MITVKLGTTSVSISHEDNVVVTDFHNGKRLIARTVNITEEDEARAKALGYSTVEQMNLEHDIVHTFLCTKLFDYDWSPTLMAAANEETIPEEIIKQEESLVLAFQRYLNEGFFDPCLQEYMGEPLAEVLSEDFKQTFRV